MRPIGFDPDVENEDESVLCEDCGQDIDECDCEIEEPISDEEY